MKTFYLAGQFNNWQTRQKHAFQGFENKFHTLLVELPAGPQEFRISAQTGESQAHFGADEGSPQVSLEEQVYLKEGGGNLTINLSQPGIYFFNIDFSGGESAPSLRVSAKFLSDVSQSESDKAGFGLDHFLDMKLPVTIEVGNTEIALGEAMGLGQGSVVELDQLAGDTVNVYVGGKLVAIGEPVVINDTFGVRILEILPPA